MGLSDSRRPDAPIGEVRPFSNSVQSGSGGTGALPRFGFLTVANPGHFAADLHSYSEAIPLAPLGVRRKLDGRAAGLSDGVALASEWAGIAVEAASTNPADRASLTSVATGH